MLGTLGTLGLASWGAQSPFCPGPQSPAVGSWEQGAVPSGCSPSYLFHPRQPAIHQRRLQTHQESLPADGRSPRRPSVDMKLFFIEIEKWQVAQRPCFLNT